MYLTSGSGEVSLRPSSDGAKRTNALLLGDNLTDVAMSKSADYIHVCSLLMRLVGSYVEIS